MASYENQTTSSVAENLNTSTISEGTKTAITNALEKQNTNGSPVDVKDFVAPPTVADIKGADLVTTTGGDIDLSKSKSADIKNLVAIIITDDTKTNIVIKNNSFQGSVVLGDGDSNVQLNTNKSVTVETGAGNDSVATGSGKDSVVVSSGNDSVNTGSGNDSVQIKTGFTGDAKIDGGSGSNTLSISDSADVKFDSKGNLIITSGDSTVTAKNFTAVVLGNNGDNVDTSASKKALNITSGTGDDSISTGSGKDSITISGGSDSVSTGAGVDIVKLAAAFTGNLTVDGGAGSDKLDLSNVSISSVKVVGGVVIITTADGGTIESSNIENFVYDSNGPDVKGGIKTVGVKSFDKAFVDDAN